MSPHPGRPKPIRGETPRRSGARFSQCRSLG
ncbi:MAG: phage DNA packaging protein J [Novipirellula sp. JB048]